MFGTLERTADLNMEGIGMGLVICKRLVEANQGRIYIHSEGANQGTAVKFNMKMRVPND